MLTDKSVLTDECAEFLLEVLRFRLDEIELIWFFSDWSDCPPRDFAQRVEDLCASRLAPGREAFVAEFL